MAIRRYSRRNSRDPLTRSQIMSRIRSKDTRPEKITRSLVHGLGHRFRINVPTLPGKPDLANKKKKWTVFVHGCFWHSHVGCRLSSSPKSNRDYWIPKLASNVERDQQKKAELEALGYRVLVIWECETLDVPTLKSDLVCFFQELEASHASNHNLRTNGDCLRDTTTPSIGAVPRRLVIS